MRRLLPDTRGQNMAMFALVLAFLLAPMTTLVVDVPRYFILRATLQSAVDAAAEAAARCVDVAWYQERGESRLDVDCARVEARRYFGVVTADAGTGYAFHLEEIAIDEAADTVTARGSGTLTTFLGDLIPRITVNAAGTSGFRLTQE